MSGTIVIIRPGERLGQHHDAKRWTKTGQPDFEVLRDAIGGGWIERVKVRYEGRVRDAFVDEEGLIKQQPPNDCATALCVHHHFIVGIMAIWVPDSKKAKS